MSEPLRCMLCDDSYADNQMHGVKGALDPGECLEPGAAIVRVDLCGIPIPGIVATAGAPMLAEGFQLLFPVCSHECRQALSILSVLDSVAYARKVPDPTVEAVFGLRLWTDGREFVVTDEIMPQIQHLLEYLPDRVRKKLGLTAEEITPPKALDHACGWCLREIADNAPVKAANIRLHPADRDRGPGVSSTRIGTRDAVCIVPVAGSPASFECDAFIVLCGDECLAELTAAIARDKRLKIVH